MLRLENIVVKYGGITALKNISIEVPENKIVALIGANGAGKSTTVRTISKLVKPSSGKIFYRGKDVTNASPKEMVQQGVIQCPEGRHVFPNLTINENLRIGAYLRSKEEYKESLEHVYKLFPRLKERGRQLAGTMSGGEQQMLAIGRALMSKPSLLMLDEPSLGLAPRVISDIFKTIKQLNQESNMTILLIEQNANMALNIADYAYVLEIGKIGLEGSGKTLLGNEQVKELYLGKGQ